jgi:purine catabolism regulator
MVVAADRLSLPLMSTAYEVPFAALARVVIDANEHDERQRVAKTERLYDRVRQAAVGGGQAPLVAGVSEELGCDLLVLDLVAWRDVFAPRVPVPEAVRSVLEHALSERRGHLPGILRLEVDGAPAVAVSIPSRRAVALVAVEGAAGAPALSLLQHAATIVAAEVERLHAERAARQRQGVELLASILHGRLDAAAAATRLREWELGDAPIQLAVCERTGAEIDVEHLDGELCAAGVPHLLLGEEQRVIALFPDGEEPLSAFLQALADDARVGLRDGVAGVNHVADAVREARWALVHRDKARVSRYGQHGGLFLPRTVTEARSAVDQVLGPVLEYDRRRGTELLRSLAVLLRHNRRSQRAAEELLIHRQTLVFRMRRVEELTGRRLSSIADVSELWQALRALEVLEGFELVGRGPPVA